MITNFSLDFLQNNFLRDLISYTKGYHGILLPKIANYILICHFIVTPEYEIWFGLHSSFRSSICHISDAQFLSLVGMMHVTKAILISSRKVPIHSIQFSV